MNWEGLIKVANIIIWSMVAGACGGLLCGCEEAQQQWGQGDPSTEWQSFFGNSNIAHLDFVQTQAINQHQTVIYGVTLEDPNGQTVRKRGLVERITALESLTERVMKLEDEHIRIDPNE